MNADMHAFELTVQAACAETDADRATALTELCSDGRPDIAAALAVSAAPIQASR